MIQRFNFFDIYGYAIPGGYWLVLMWIPFQLVGGSLPGTAAQITVLGLGASYIAGHLLYQVAAALFPSTRGGQYLSESLLDAADSRLSSQVKETLKKELLERFKIDVTTAEGKKEAFFLCRTALVQGKVSAYIEQFQGMQVLTRGLATASLLAVVFYLGWLLAVHFALPDGTGQIRFHFLLAIGIVLVPSVLTMVRNRRAASIMLALVLGLIGFGAGRWHPSWHSLSVTQAYELAVIATIILIASWNFKLAADRFDEELAKATYRDFVVLTTKA